MPALARFRPATVPLTVALVAALGGCARDVTTTPAAITAPVTSAAASRLPQAQSQGENEDGEKADELPIHEPI